MQQSREAQGFAAGVVETGVASGYLGDPGDDPANPLARLNGRYGDIYQLRNSGSASYDGATLGVIGRDVGDLGLQLWASYTWSHAIDTVGTGPVGYGFVPGLLDPFDPKLDRGDADTDARHRVVASGVWDLPLAPNAGGWRERVLDGYVVRTRADSPVSSAQSGDTAQREAALASGAQWVSTDYPVPGRAERLGTDYVARLPGGAPARCNPVNTGPHCRDAALE